MLLVRSMVRAMACSSELRRGTAGTATGATAARPTLRRGRQLGFQLLQLGDEEVRHADADTPLDNGRAQHLVHGLVRAAEEVHGPCDGLLLRIGVEARLRQCKYAGATIALVKFGTACCASPAWNETVSPRPGLRPWRNTSRRPRTRPCSWRALQRGCLKPASVGSRRSP